MARVHRVIISWRFNCFAEALLAQLRPAPTWLFHTDKTPAQLAAFKKPGWLRGEIAVDRGTTLHGALLDVILSERRWPDLLAADVLLFVDHDCVYTVGHSLKTQMGQRLVAGIMAGHVISARTEPWVQNTAERVFLTTPAFAVNPSVKWPDSWCGCEVTPGVPGVFYDTGQKIALRPDIRSRCDVFEWPVEGLLHWGSMYDYFMRMPHTDKSHRDALDLYRYLAGTGIWRVGDADIDRVHQHPMLGEAFRIMSGQG